MSCHLLVVPELPPDPIRVHWSAISKAKKSWRSWVWALAKHADLPRCAAGEHRHVHIDFHRPGPKSDVDNAYRQCKVPLDALVRAELLEDDRPACVTLTCDTHSCGRTDTRTEIRVTTV